MDVMVINIPVEADLAQVYNAASVEDRQKIHVLVRLWLREMAAPGEMSLSDLMDTISDRAQERGLTPEILDSLP